ncbi:bifunctional precorrin-2 dehydrogenase/sirohydrochlorin ferrochelatase [Sulfuricurvum sp.]|uniref:precorrin-2 dehydrogenase/sirohydrochlorin ferrochelatase family protein n=1 Tax=Sulfuricurvum sp. TaxID=2025608 RepID=UPI002E30B6AC|nr:bifunctional precorrin-2 dehydrogenase/sirohydrochlorin ferrochelatase [Sulfuricurvum sp.]HEX5330104.1 bifunctional precorrin-2 dehydrogenase/sirohydrochlorin ferrochelatase [Sulfuricurvum sp.]
MAYFPMFIDLRGQDCLVVGGGEVALRKIEQLVKFAPNLCVIAPSIHPEIDDLAQNYPITIEKRPYMKDDLKERFLVIGALDDLSEQEKIFQFCTTHHIHVNCVDSPLLCSFIFPALIVNDDLCVGINTAGRAPAVSSALRQYLTKMIPSGIIDLIDKVDHIRQSEPIGKPRQAKIIAICKAFFEQ